MKVSLKRLSFAVFQRLMRTYTSKSWQDVNAAVSDDDLLALGTGMAVMQTAPLAEVIRIDTGELTA